MKPLFHSFTSAAIALLGLLAASPASAQTGKTGTTIRMDGNTCHALYSDGAGKTTVSEQYFSFLRHDISHVQLVLSNAPDLDTRGNGNFATNANNMIFKNGELGLYNWTNHSRFVYFAIIAPKGYRFTRYQMEGVRGTADTYISRYTYDGDRTPNYLADSITVNGEARTWDVPMGNGSNILYFRYNTNAANGTINGTTVGTQVPLFLKSLKLTYVIDDPFTAALPSSDGTTEIHTGLLDLGTFSNNTSGVWTYDQTNGITDTQLANLYENSSKVAPKVATTADGTHYFLAASNGDYYVEAPKKFRIVGAKLQFLRSDATLSDGEVKVTKPGNINRGSSYAISDGNGHYLVRNGSSLTVTNDPTKATQWTISGRNSYTIQDGSHYLVHGFYTGSLSISTSNSSSSWNWSSSRGFYYSYSYGWGTTYTYYLTYNNGWTVSTSPNYYGNPMTITTSGATTTTGGDFTATPYTRDDKENATDAKTLTEGEADATVELKDFNNDAIHFSISGLAEGCSALYSVDLQLMPLNPELQNLSVSSKLSDGTEIKNTQSFSAENYEFNAGNDVVVTVPTGTKECGIVFRNAVNENRTQWYTNGSKENADEKGGYSNYFLVNSTADNGTAPAVNLNTEATNHPTDRTSATQAGKKKLFFTNIDDIYTISGGSFGPGSASTLQDNDFSKTDAKYGDVTLTTGDPATTCYVYVADQPTWNILPAEANAKHIDFRYFTLKVRSKAETAKAVVTLTPLYTKTLKSQNHKNADIASDGNTLDEKHTYYGVKVTAEVDGQEMHTPLSSQAVVEAIKNALAEVNYGGFDATDPFRGVLYIDMSALESVDVEAFTNDFHNSTADNCLYFMYKGFHRSGITNAVAIKDNGSFEAVSNITVYDQQPFFTPYDFTTGSRTVTYDREQTAADGSNTLALVKNMTVVLPFDVQLNENGNLKTASDAVNNTVTYHNLTGQDGVPTCVRKGDGGELTYGILAEEVKDGVAHANQPYYVTSTTPGFTYNILGAKFTKSGEVNGESVTLAELTRTTNNVWKGIGTYCGETPKKSPLLWYFSKDLFWKSSNLKNYDVVYARPFRAYFTTTEEAAGTKASVAFDPNDLEPTGISDINAGKAGLQIVAGRGGLAVSSDADTTVRVFTVAGQLVANEDITAGETLRMSVPQGVYLVNGTKVVVR